MLGQPSVQCLKLNKKMLLPVLHIIQKQFICKLEIITVIRKIIGGHSYNFTKACAAKKYLFYASDIIKT